MLTLLGAVEDIQNAGDFETLRRALAAALKLCGFDVYQLAINVGSREEMMFSSIQTSPMAFVTEFEQLGLVGSDPILAGIFGSRQPFRFNTRELATGQDGRRNKRWSEYFSELPPISGVAIPLPSGGGRISAATVSAVGDKQFDERSIASASIILRFAMMRAQILGLVRSEGSASLLDFGLSARQIEVLRWAAAGKSNTDIGAILGQSKRTVDYHMSEILRKLGVSSRSQAIALSRR